MLRTKLKNWQFRMIEREAGYEQVYRRPFPLLPAEVPGMVHVDLARNGVIPDPFQGMAHVGLSWVDECDWAYQTEFVADPSAFPHSALRFECLDGVAEIELNGVLLAVHDNAFLPVEIPVQEHLQPSNVLQITFRSPVAEATSRRTAYLKNHGLPHDQRCFDERSFLRKPAYMWGWDWAPRLVSCGIAGNVELLQFQNRVSLSLNTRHLEGSRYLLTAETQFTGDPPTLELLLGPEGRLIEDEKSSWIIEGGEWHPRGHGPQTLHIVRALTNEEVVEQRFGLRRVELRREPDQHGESFTFEVNGNPIWAKGANWIPPSFFYASGPTPAEIDDRIAEFASLGFNMLRVWGGGRYETDAFYEACDRHGILVWQDFPFACMYYPDDEHWQEVIRQEARYHVERLRAHPSLALWCGNNECQTMHESWLGENAAPTFHGERLYGGVLPEAIAELDPASPYIPTSPTGSDPASAPNCNNPNFGDCHYWEVWHGKGDWTHYRDIEPRFCAEFGFASPCSMAKWIETISKEDIDRFPGPEFLSHDKTGKDFDHIRSLVELHYPRASSLEEWVYFAQLNQRDAIRCAIEHFRSCSSCAGALIWQANDCWPGSTWSMRDSEGIYKPIAFELERLFAEVAISAVTTNGKLVGTLVNNSPGDASGQLRVEIFDTITGLSHDPGDYKVDRASRSAFRLSIDGMPKSERWVFLVEPKDLQLELAQIEMRVGRYLEISLDKFVADLVAYNALTFEPLRLAGQVLRGAKPITSAPGVVRYEVPEPEGPLVFRSLAGVHPTR